MTPAALRLAARARDAVVVTGADDVSAFDRQLDDLARRCDAPATSSWPWMAPAVADPASAVTAILVGDGSGELSASAVFTALHRPDGALSVRSAAGGDGHRAVMPASDDSAAERLVDMIGEWAATALPPNTTVTLGPMPAHDRVARAALVGLADDAEVTTQRVPHVRRPAPGTTDGYLSHGMARTLRKATNRLRTESRAVAVASTPDVDAIATAMPALMHAVRERDFAAGRVSALDRPEIRRRWASRLVGLARLGRLELTTLTIDRQPAAFTLGIPDGRAYRILDGRMFGSFERYAPGRLLEAEILRRCFAAGRFDVVDWMTSLAPDKLLAADGAEDVVTLRLTT